VRDILILLMLVIVTPFILKRPWIGIIAWVVVSVMNPHRMTYGFAYNLPVAQVIVIATLLGMLFSRDSKNFPLTPVTAMLLFFVFWMNLTTVFALYPADAFVQWVKVMKIMFVLFLGMAILHTRVHLNALVWAIVGSLGFFGVKGGLFALLTGGAYRIYGPPDSDVGDNNAISFALVVTLPLMYYLFTTSPNKWIKRGLLVSIGLCALAILASHSRGAFLALGAMTMLLWLKSDRRGWLGVSILLAVPAMLALMPEEWFARRSTIRTYEQDASSMGRINTWTMAFNLAKDHPIFGGGFQIYNAGSFARWAPNPLDIHAAHSIYFAALGEHGFVGLFIFLTLFGLTWQTGSYVAKTTRKIPELAWAASLGRMLQVSLIGFAVGGAFLSVLYFDVFYYLIAILVLLRRIVEEEVLSLAASNAAIGRATAKHAV
jgi:probable O-glycosylation ligase (exosortase A-associated)